MNEGEKSGNAFATARGRDWPSVRQFNIFLENRIGGLLDVVRRFEGANLRIVSLMVIDSSDVAIIRMVFSDPERAVEILEQAKLPYTESDLLVVQVPEGPHPLLSITKALLQGEFDIHYVYPLLVEVGTTGTTALALHVEDIESASAAMQQQGFTIVTDQDLAD